MVLREGDLELALPPGATGWKFDDEAVHGLSHCMKAVDFVIELPDCLLFVEITASSLLRSKTLSTPPADPKTGTSSLAGLRREVWTTTSSTNTEIRFCINGPAGMWEKSRSTILFL